MIDKPKIKWDDFDSNVFLPAYNTLLEVLQNINKFCTYMITVGLATIGFFISVLIQIKKDPVLPNKHFATFSMAFLALSVVLGFIMRFKMETRDFLRKVQEGFQQLSFVIKDIKKYEISSDEEQLIDSGMKAFSIIDKEMDKAKNYLLSNRYFIYLIVQGISLLIGIALFAIYMFFYLFLL